MSPPLHQCVEQLAVPELSKAASSALVVAGPKGHAAVRAGLSHPDWRVRRGCARFIDHHPDPRSLERLVLTLHDPKCKVRAAAVHALGCDLCKGDHADRVDPVPHLIKRVREDKSVRVRRMATTMLAIQPPSRRIARVLRRIVQTPDDPKMKRVATWGLTRHA